MAPGRKKRLGRMAFTLVEVNLAMFIMAVGILTMVALYPLAYRENMQASEDVMGAMIANNIMNYITARLQDPEIKWGEWKRCVDDAVRASGPRGWLELLENENDQNNYDAPRLRSFVNGKANQVLSVISGVGTNPGGAGGDLSALACGLEQGYTCAIVAGYAWMPLASAGGEGTSGAVQYEKDYTRLAVSVRVARQNRALLTQPLYFTEVRFQGKGGGQ